MHGGTTPLSDAPACFGSSEPFRIGVEEELFTVDPATLAIRPGTDAILERAEWNGGHGCGEISDGMLELVSEVLDSGPQAGETPAWPARARSSAAAFRAAVCHATSRTTPTSRRPSIRSAVRGQCFVLLAEETSGASVREPARLVAV